MSNGMIAIVVVAIMAVLVLAVIWRYKVSGQAEFSITKWLTFRFKGSNRQGSARTEVKGVRLEKGSHVQANEVVGGDKITVNVSATEPSAPSKSPRLALSLFELSRAHTYRHSIEINQPDAHHGNRYLIGLVLENEEDVAPAKGIQITLKFYWRGEPPNKAIECRYSPQDGEEGWTTRVLQLSNDQPAVLVYSGPELMCFNRQPVEWRGLAIATKEKLNGQIRLQYEVSSLQPQSHRADLLGIDFK